MDSRSYALQNNDGTFACSLVFRTFVLLPFHVFNIFNRSPLCVPICVLFLPVHVFRFVFGSCTCYQTQFLLILKSSLGCSNVCRGWAGEVHGRDKGFALELFERRSRVGGGRWAGYGLHVHKNAASTSFYSPPWQTFTGLGLYISPTDMRRGKRPLAAVGFGLV